MGTSTVAASVRHQYTWALRGWRFVILIVPHVVAARGDSDFLACLRFDKVVSDGSRVVPAEMVRCLPERPAFDRGENSPASSSTPWRELLGFRMRSNSQYPNKQHECENRRNHTDDTVYGGEKEAQDNHPECGEQERDRECGE